MRNVPATLAVALLASACGGGSAATPSPDAPPAPASADVVRFLEQATFGPTDALVAEVQAEGIPAYLDAQLAMAPSSLGDYPPILQAPNVYCMAADAPPNCNRDYGSTFPVSARFMKDALTAPDQLRRRVALALSQILVVSGVEVKPTYAIAAYQQLLVDDAFGSFRQLLEDVTLSPSMGRYLNMVNNDKPNPKTGTNPNENYARELMQLFSIGLVQLHPDGTPVLSATGDPIPTYDQDVIEDTARVFTGWTYPPAPGAASARHNPPYFVGKMVAVADLHDDGKKVVLGGAVLPAGQTPEKDLADELDVIFHHPNVGPFVGRQLIQHLVTSNPSPAYVARVADVFANDGKGVRGNLAAVVRAILLDPEARGDAKADASYGKLREPVLYVAALARALGADSDGVYLRSAVAGLEQDLYQPATVFSFYPPEATLPGGTLLSPPSVLYDSTTSLGRANFVYTLVYKGVAADPSVGGATGTHATLAPLAALAGDPGALVDKLDALLLHRTMTPAMRQAVVDAVGALPASDPTGRARLAAYLVGTSIAYQVER